MKQYIQYKNILATLLLFVSFSSFGQTFRKNKAVTRLFKIEQDTELTVRNKYGNIQLITWDKDSVKFEIKIEVRDKKEAKAINKIDAIDIDFVSSKHYVEAKTYFTGENAFWSDVKDKTGNVFSSENKTQVNYVVYLPIEMALTIENKYGDILMDDHLGTAFITLLNGDLKAHALKGKTSINLEFAYANIKQMSYARFNLGYHSEIQLTKAEELKIESRSSHIRIETAGKIDIKSYRDKCHIENVGVFIAKNSYTYLEIQRVSEFVSIDAKYGDIDIKHIEKGVSKITFDTENTDINIIQPPNRSIEFNLVYNEKAGLYFPEELQNKTTTKKNEEEKLVETTGVLGAQKLNPLQVNATLISGNIRVDSN